MKVQLFEEGVVMDEVIGELHLRFEPAPEGAAGSSAGSGSGSSSVLGHGHGVVYATLGQREWHSVSSGGRLRLTAYKLDSR